MNGIAVLKGRYDIEDLSHIAFCNSFYPMLWKWSRLALYRHIMRKISMLIFDHFYPISTNCNFVLYVDIIYLYLKVPSLINQIQVCSYSQLH